MARKLVIFADGTGNAFNTQESNVWRLYGALDRAQPDQVARYIAGVGTSGFKPYAILDGVTGIGVPSNVRELYRFLCWSWQPGDEIHMFGFSRGAFTIRTLVGLIHHEGLMPAVIGGRRVSRAEMDRNTMAAWRSYRAKSHPWRGWLPTIGAARLVRDGMLAAWHGALRHMPHKAVVAAAADRRHVPIRYLGLFDTVEAYGVPIDELRAAIDTVVWPISFRNRQLSPLVQQVRHALSLDDERRTFHPLRFDRSAETDARIEELWFAGAHSDVGGGYPDGELALVPLGWIAEGAAAAGLRFDGSVLADRAEAASPFGPRHDPRRGLAMFYRYAPRPIGRGAEDGGEPVVHPAVPARILSGSDGYAPLMLPGTALEMVPGGAPRPVSARPGLEGDDALISAAHDVVWWRRLAYWLLFASAALLVALPVLGDWLAEQPDGAGRLAGAVARLDEGIGANLASVRGVLGGLVPDYAAAWVNAIVGHPVLAAGLALLFAGLARWNTRLSDRARDLARAAWLAPASVAPPSAAMGLARPLRHWRGSAALERFATRVVLPVTLVATLAGGALVSISRTTVTYRQGVGMLCRTVGPAQAPRDDHRVVEASSLFPVDAPCWASGIWLEQGRRYTLWIDQDTAFFDRSIMSGVGGFRSESWLHRISLPIRRWWRAEWFQPIARIGATGSTEWPLLTLERFEVPLAGAGFRPDGRRRVVEVEQDDGFTPPLRLDEHGRIADSSLPEATRAHARQGLDRRLVTRFTAPESGELFLYLNDAIFAAPLLPTGTMFYANNRGTARVRVELQRLPEPQ